MVLYRFYHTISFRIFFAIALIAVFAFGFYSQALAGNLTGWAWSDTPNGNPAGDRGAGWIEFAPATGPGVTVSAGGGFSGYAWSEHIGWVSFNASETSSCGANAALNKSTGAVTGFAKALGGNDAQAGGWDGCISLNPGVSGSGITVDASCNYKGYAWGGPILGWIKFDHGIVGQEVKGTNADACLTVTVSNSAPIAEAGISKDGITYSSSITVTQGVAVTLRLSADRDVTGDAQASRDPNGWTDPTYGVSSGGGKCEWNTDLNQGTPIFEQTISNPASAGSCNIMSTVSRTFNDAPGTYTYQVLRITDQPGAASNIASVSVTVQAAPTTNSSPIAEAGISTNSSSYSSAITVTQGVAVNLWLSADRDVTGDAQASRDPNGWTDPTYGVSSGGKCDWNSDLNQGAPTYEQTVSNPASATTCNISLGLRTFNDAPGTYTYQVLRITDQPGAASNIASVSVTVQAVPIPTLIVTPASATVNVGGTQQFTAAYDPDGSGPLAAQTVTSSAVWSSLNTAAATVNSSGLATGVGAGTASIRATYSGLTASGSLSVNGPDLVTENLLLIDSSGNPTTTPSVGSSITFRGTVTNLGPGSAALSSASISVDGSSFQTINNIGPLGNGSSQTINSTPWTASPAGSHSVTVCADSGGSVSESNEGNNCTTLPFSVGQLPPDWCEIPSDAPPDYQCPP